MNVNGLPASDDIIQRDIEPLRAKYAKEFKADVTTFEGRSVTLENIVVNTNTNTNTNTKTNVTVSAYYYIDASGKKIHHGLARYYRNKEIIWEGVFTEGIPNYYIIYKSPKQVMQVIFKDGKPWSGTYPILGHGIFGITFRDGVPVKAESFDDKGMLTAVLFDMSGATLKDGQPWNGEFLSMADKNINTYVNGKIISNRECESLGFIAELFEPFNKKQKN